MASSIGSLVVWIAGVVLAGCSSSGGGGGSAGSAAAGGGSGAGGSGANAGSGGSGGSAAAGGLAGAGGQAGSGGAGGAGAGAGTAGSGGTSGTGGGSGAEQCDNQQDDDGDGFHDCDDSDCFGNATCIESDLSTSGMAGFVPCGTPVSFTNADSDVACSGYTLGFFETKCQFASYSGTVSFYCSPAPKTDAVGVRWVVHAQVPVETIGNKSVYWETLSGDFSFGNSGGSGTNPLHKTFDSQAGLMTEDFVGYQKLPVDLTTKGVFTNWFGIWDLLSANSPRIAGGFSVPIDAAALFGS